MLSFYCDAESFKQFAYFYKCTCVFLVCGIITETRDSFLSADDGGVSGVQADGKRLGQ
jgi:hypothetical protein